MLRHLVCLSAFVANACASSVNSTGNEIDAKLAQIHVNALKGGCTPELAEQARIRNQACALLIYKFDSAKCCITLDRRPTETLIRPAIGFTPPVDGDARRAKVHVRVGPENQPAEVSLADLNSHRIVSYDSRGGSVEYRLVAIIHPSICQSDPAYCMVDYDPAIFDLARYKN